jgi:hypothetical protein
MGLLLALSLCQNVQAQSFSRHFNLYEDWWEYLYVAIDAEVYSEAYAGSATFWRPTQVDVPATIIYRFPFDRQIAQAQLAASMAVWTLGDEFPYDPGAYAYLDVSPDGIVWWNVDGRYAYNGGGSYGPYDITPAVQGADQLWVRATLLGTVAWPGDGPIFAQFLRTAPGSDSSVFALDVTFFTDPGDADLNGDGWVDRFDLQEWEAAWGTPWGDGDANGDAVTDGRDLLAWQRAFGQSPTAAVGEVVPEPGAASVLTLLLACVLILRTPGRNG